MRSLILAAALAAALPSHGTLVPGRSLGGIRLGATPAQVEAAWGRFFGRCRGCAAPTWYFTYGKFRATGLGVQFRQGRVEALFTLARPAGWHTPRGLVLGDAVARLTQLYGALLRNQCNGYTAYLLPARSVTTEFYVAGGTVWGFGLTRTGLSACR